MSISIQKISLLSIAALSLLGNANAQNNVAAPYFPAFQSGFGEVAAKGTLTRVDQNDKLLQLDKQQATLAPAPGLSRIAILAVGSDQSNCGGGWEYMTTIGQFSTVCNHGGSLMRVAVQEIGYGGTPTMYMAGSFIPSSKIYATQTICVVGGSYVWPCPAGYTVVGFIRYVNLDGYQSGRLTYQNYSLNVGPTISTAINIQ